MLKTASEKKNLLYYLSTYDLFNVFLTSSHLALRTDSQCFKVVRASG